MVEYHGWGPSRRWRNELIEDPPFRPIRMPIEVERALDKDPKAPHFLGSSAKYFDTVFEEFFYGYSGKLLTPDDARATAEWMSTWAAQPDRDPALAAKTTDAARRLAAAADFGWYLYWEQ